MKFHFALLFYFSLFLFSCDDENDTENSEPATSIPQIEFSEVSFIDVPNDADSIIVRIKFSDLEMNLGLNYNDIEFPFNWKHYFSNKTGKYIDFENESYDDLLTIKNIDVIDTLPAFDSEYSYLYWDHSPNIYLSDGTQLDDTVYYQLNNFHTNLFVNYYFRKNSEDFELFDFRKQFETLNYHARFPRIPPTATINRYPITIQEGSIKIIVTSRTSGFIEYGMASFGFKPLFGGKDLKLRISIADRDLNVSNVVETDIIQIPL
ncbi:MAG: hypothetical protein RLO81_19720 [Fulvivirga sp.]|uniref:hypothetical protein n=1 Tax=Fulvivirga sp. TaxID=1931237 RepID=UPI0032ED65DF